MGLTELTTIFHDCDLFPLKGELSLILRRYDYDLDHLLE